MKNIEAQALIPGYLIFLLALTTGLAVSAIYLIQPLLHTLSQALGVSTQKIGLVMTLTQAGYGIGILFLIPLGDIFPKKSLIVKKLVLLAIALAFLGFSTTFAMILWGSLAIGFFASTAQDVVPFAADLSTEKKRGEIVGKVMSGLLLGILLSRTVSGVVSDLWGWRWVFWLTGGAVLAVGILLYFSVADRPAKSSLPYASLLKSTLRNFAIYPVLRNAIYTQGLLGIAFSAFWTNLSFFVAGPPFQLSNTHIGLFGLAGAAGALVAPLAGKLADKKGSQIGITLGAGLVALSFLTMSVFPFSLACLVAGTVVFDLGVQMSLISHQTVIYALDANSRARLNALFIAAMFGAFSLGSLLSVKLQATWGWRAVLGVGLAASGLAFLNAIILWRKRLYSSPPKSDLQ